MDRRQRKTRKAIFDSFIQLLSKKSFENITVSEILDTADVGRATFYSHFETKDYLLKELCRELFCHIFDALHGENSHNHIFNCNSKENVFLHLLRHLQKNDNHILDLLAGSNNELFSRYFTVELKALVKDNFHIFENEKYKLIPLDFRINQITASFIETVKWWYNNKMAQSAETVADYFFISVS